MVRSYYVLALILLTGCTSKEPASNFLSVLDLKGPVKEVIYDVNSGENMNPLVGTAIHWVEDSSALLGINQVTLSFDENGLLAGRTLSFKSAMSYNNPSVPVHFNIFTEYEYHKNNVSQITNGLNTSDLVRISRNPQSDYVLNIELNSEMQLESTDCGGTKCTFMYNQQGLYECVGKSSQLYFVNKYSQNKLVQSERTFYPNTPRPSRVNVTYIYNQDGLLTAEQFQHPNSPNHHTERQYINYELDDYGNWIGRTEIRIEDGCSNDTIIQHRIITYY